jgi:hypothetical protein
VTSLPGMPVPPPEEIILDDSGSPRRASSLPLALVLISLPLSAAIALLLQYLGAEWWSVVGYALTPLFTVIATGWDAVSQLSGRKDPWFAVRPGLSRALRICVVIGIGLGVVHIWRISGWLAREAIQQGWPFLT